MTDVSITPEDRERLAKGKFLEWLFDGLEDEKVNKRLDERIDNRIVAYTQARAGRTQQPQAPQGQQPQQTTEEAPRKRNLLETCLSQTFGF